MKTAREIAIEFHKKHFPDIDCDSECAVITNLEPLLHSYAESIREECARVVDECHYAPNDLASAIRSIEIK